MSKSNPKSSAQTPIWWHFCQPAKNSSGKSQWNKHFTASSVLTALHFIFSQLSWIHSSLTLVNFSRLYNWTWQFLLFSTSESQYSKSQLPHISATSQFNYCCTWLSDKSCQPYNLPCMFSFHFCYITSDPLLPKHQPAHLFCLWNVTSWPHGVRYNFKPHLSQSQEHSNLHDSLVTQDFYRNFPTNSCCVK